MDLSDSYYRTATELFDELEEGAISPEKLWPGYLTHSLEEGYSLGVILETFNELKTRTRDLLQGIPRGDIFYTCRMIAIELKFRLNQIGINTDVLKFRDEDREIHYKLMLQELGEVDPWQQLYQRLHMPERRAAG